MIYGKLWLVVKPTTGIPVFLGAVAISSFLVHLMLVTNTTWVKRFLEGSGTKTAAVEATTPTAAAPPTDTLVVASAQPAAKP
jgi:light-harvesting protein B-800-850 alpha chain